jgi:hypothetical protein
MGAVLNMKNYRALKIAEIVTEDIRTAEVF